ncbi:MAG: 50S ribosomal protein L39e [Candidatus Micrarchaeota archaeon]
MSKKDSEKKGRLAKAKKQNRRLPIFVTIRTKRKVQANNSRRNWRRDKIKD